MKVSEVMNKVMVVDDNISLKQAAKIMSDKNIGCLIVTKNDKILGIITESDIVKNVNALEKKVSQVMNKNVACVDREDEINQAARLMAEKKIKRLPVLKGDELVGIITVTDLIANAEELDDDFFFD
jgi:CBS domain-containing protein